MPKKKSALLHKLSNLLKISIFLAKLKKPMIPKLVFLKKARKLKRFKLPGHYSSYIKEYEFSPSSTPLIQLNTRLKNGRLRFRKLYSNVLLISRCMGTVRDGEKEINYCLDEPEVGRELAIDLWNWSDEDDDSVDERAERFIQSFYQEMRMQRQESTFQLEI